jgi:hypothetical protein
MYPSRIAPFSDQNKIHLIPFQPAKVRVRGPLRKGQEGKHRSVRQASGDSKSGTQDLDNLGVPVL